MLNAQNILTSESRPYEACFVVKLEISFLMQIELLLDNAHSTHPGVGAEQVHSLHYKYT